MSDVLLCFFILMGVKVERKKVRAEVEKGKCEIVVDV